MDRRQTALRVLVVSLVLGLYALACALPAVRGYDRTVPGIRLLLGGWMSPLYWAPWSANVLLGVGLLAVVGHCYRAAATLGWTAAGLGLTAWFFEKDYLIGCYFWQASPILLALGAGVLASHDARLGRKFSASSGKRQSLG
jgi:hypothetical protein